MASVAPNPTKRAAIYVRVSTLGQQEDGTSLGTQEDRCRQHAGSTGYSVDPDQIYRETHTGTELWERPQLTRLREAVRRREVALVIAYAIDRLARDPVHLGVIISEAEHAGVDVQFVSEPLDHSPEGQLIRYVRGYAAKVEHEKIKERSLRGRLARVQAGKLLPGGRPLYGYRWRDETKAALEIDEVTGPVIQRLFRDASQGVSLRQLAIRLTQEGVPTPTGRVSHWATSSLHTIFRHPGYTGRAIAWCWRPKEGMQTISLDEEQAIELPDGTIPPLVTLDLWHAVEQRLALNKLRSQRNNRHPESGLLRGGYVRCGYCRRSLHIIKGPRGAYEYHCGYALRTGQCSYHNIKAEILDTEVWERIRSRLLDEETIAGELANLQTNDPVADDLRTIDRALADATRRQTNLSRVLATLDDPDTTAPILAELAAMGTRKRQLETERARRLERQLAWQATQDQVANLQAYCRSVAAKVHGFGYDQKRLALDAFDVQVLLYRADHTPRWEIEAGIPLDSVQNRK